MSTFKLFKKKSMIESGRASITATIEPLVATAIGVYLYNEILTAYQLLGFLLIIAAVVLIQWKRSKRKKVARTL